MKKLNTSVTRKIISLLSTGFKMASVDTWNSGKSLNINLSQLRQNAEAGNTITLKNDFNDSFEFGDIFA
jgi:hypothetical protein